MPQPARSTTSVVGHVSFLLSHVDRAWLALLFKRNIHTTQTQCVSEKQIHGAIRKARQGKARQGKARQGKARQGKARQGKARQGKARHGKARQGKARQGKARQGKADEMRSVDHDCTTVLTAWSRRRRSPSGHSLRRRLPVRKSQAWRASGAHRLGTDEPI
jgi:ATPase subunit of ABC transporter with duplicated ATPase domains